MLIMGVKKKPYAFYIINIIIYIFTFITFIVTQSTLLELEQTVLDLRVTRLVRDLLTLSFLSQIFSAAIVFVRATGFNLKKFDFKRDLQDLDIKEEDSEEFEIDVNFDKNKTRRGIRKNIRFLKYAYKENKLFALSLTGAIILAISITIYVNLTDKQEILTKNTIVTANGFSLSIQDVYLTSKDYKGNVIDDDTSYLIVRANVKRNNLDQVLDIGTTKILIDKFVYIPSLTKKDILFNYGNIYNFENLNYDYEIKTFIYELPKQLINKEMIFSYVNKATGKDSKIKINYIDIDKIKEEKTFNLKETINFDEVLKDYSLTIDSFEINSKHKIEYKLSLGNNAYPSYEYIVPSVSSKYAKTILKITGNLQTSDIKLVNIFDLYDFINSFGKLKYVIGETTYIQSINFKEVEPKKTKQKDTYYIEVLEEINKASKVSIVFKVNDKIYEYVLK